MHGWRVEKRFAIGGTKMSDIEVRELDSSEYELWDDLVEKSPHGTIFHNSDWLVVCRDVLNEDLKIYGCFKNDELIGGCSLFIKNVAGIMKVASSTCKMTPYGGVVLAPSISTKVRKREQTHKDIIKSLCNAIDNEHFDHIQITNSSDFVDIRPFIWDRWNSNIHYAYYFNLEGDIERNIPKKARESIKQANRNSISIRNSKDFSIFYDLFSMTFKRQNLRSPVTKEFFMRAIDLLKSKNIGGMWVAETPSGELASALIILWDNKRSYAWANGSNTSFRHTAPNSLLYSIVFQDLKNKGFKEINLMSANTPQLAKFMSTFNPKLVPYYAVEKSSIRYKVAANAYGIIKHIKGKGNKKTES